MAKFALNTWFSDIGDLGSSLALIKIIRIRRVIFFCFFQLLSAFGSVAEHCLPSILKTLIAWYEKQGVEWIISEYKPSKSDSKGRSELSHVSEQEFVSGRPLPLQKFKVLKSFFVCWGQCCGSGSGAFFTPGSRSRIGFFPDPGSRIPDPKPIYLRSF